MGAPQTRLGALARETQEIHMGCHPSTHVSSLKSLCGGGVPCSHPSLGLSVFFLSFYKSQVAPTVHIHTPGRTAHAGKLLSHHLDARLAGASALAGSENRVVASPIDAA